MEDSPAGQVCEPKIVTKQGGRESQAARNDIPWRRDRADILITDTIKKLSYQRGFLGRVSVCGLVRCQSRSIIFVLPLSAADGDLLLLLISTQPHSSLLPPPRTVEDTQRQRGRISGFCKVGTVGRVVRQKPLRELRPGKISFIFP